MAIRFTPLTAFFGDLSYHAADPFESRWARYAIRGGVLLLLAAAAFALAADSGLIWTDEAEVIKNVLLRSETGLARVWFSPTDLPSFPSRGPLAYSVLAGEYRLWRGHYLPGYHLVGFFLHAGNALLIWLILRRFDFAAAWFAAALFAVHPIQTQAVVCISNQGVVLGAFFALLSTLFTLRFLGIAPHPMDDWIKLAGEIPLASGHRGQGSVQTAVMEETNEWQEVVPLGWRIVGYSSAVFFLLCSILSAPGWSLWPVALLAFLFIRKRGIRWPEIKPILPLIAIGVVWLGIAGLIAAADSSGPDGTFSFRERLLVSAWSAWHGLFSSIFPFGLRIVYHLPPIRPSAWWLYALLLLTAALPAVLWWQRRRLGLVPLALVSAFLALTIPHAMVGDDPIGPGALVIDPLLYLSVLCVIVPVVAWLRRLMDRLSDARPYTGDAVRLGSGLALLGAAMTVSVVNANVYRDEASLWTNIVVRNPAARVAYRRLAAIQLASGKVDAAVGSLQVGLSASPNETQMLTDLGSAYETKGWWADAGDCYEKLLKLNPRDADAMAKLAHTWVLRSRPDLALEYYRKASELRPDDASLINHVGRMFAQTGKLDEAITLFKQAIAKEPNNLASQLNLAVAYYRKGLLPESAELLQGVVKADPLNFDAYQVSGAILQRMKQLPDAERMFRAAVRIDPKSAEAWEQLAGVLYAEKKLGEAIFAFRRTVELQPDNTQARRNLAAIEAENTAAINKQRQVTPDR